MKRNRAVGVDRIRIAFQVSGEEAGDIRYGDSHIAVLEVVDDAAGAVTELVGRSHAVERRGAAPARFA